jgi:hypothetical protein
MRVYFGRLPPFCAGSSAGINGTDDDTLPQAGAVYTYLKILAEPAFSDLGALILAPDCP